MPAVETEAGNFAMATVVCPPPPDAPRTRHRKAKAKKNVRNMLAQPQGLRMLWEAA